MMTKLPPCAASPSSLPVSLALLLSHLFSFLLYGILTKDSEKVPSAVAFNPWSPQLPPGPFVPKAEHLQDGEGLRFYSVLESILPTDENILFYFKKLFLSLVLFISN
jgi:hypothetical protein